MSEAEPLGQIVILNGAPRAVKSSIAAVIQEEFDGFWLNLGVDASRASTPARFQPGIGQRPGGERPDLEPMIMRLYDALYGSIAAHSRRGINVVVDAVHHDDYSRPLGILGRCAQRLRGLPVLFVGIHCPVDIALQRRRATWAGDGYLPAVEFDPVVRWHQAVHNPGRYDLDVDTSVRTPSECAQLIKARLATDRATSRFFDLESVQPFDGETKETAHG